MLAMLLSGDGTILEQTPTRAQLPLLLAQASLLTKANIGQATETDSAFPMTVVLSGASIIQAGIASETDTSLAITIVQTGSLTIPVGIASETDEALSVAFVASGGVFVSVGMATETDEAFPFVPARTFILSHDDRNLSLTAHSDNELTITPVVVE